MARLLRTAILIALILTGRVAMAQHTYYISKSTGSNSNSSTQAQSKSTPWASLPGMASCNANCGSYTPVAGDSFIMMGCDTWLASDMPVEWNWSGNASNPIYIGVDNTWYNTTACPSTWNRPIWSGQKTFISAHLFYSAWSQNTSYVTLDNIEIIQFHQGSSDPNIEIVFAGGGPDGGTISNWTYSNMYIHAWDIVTDGGCVIFGGVSNMTNTTYQYNVVNGADRTGENPAGGTCDVFYTYYGNSKILNNVIHDVVNAVLPTSGVEIGGNLIYNIIPTNAGNHCNAFETLGGGTYYIHDNVIMNMNCGGGETMFIAASQGEVDYVWNNVIFNLSGATGIAAPPTFGPGNSSITVSGVFLYNNTIVLGTSSTGGSCFNPSGQATGTLITTLNIQNNHCVTETGPVAAAGLIALGGTVTNTNNLAMTHGTATSDGYTASQTFAYSPTSSSSPTVGQGADLTSIWPAGFSSNDTSYACTYSQSAQTVTCPARAPVARPSGGWSLGAYQSGSAQGSAPNPPTNLTASVQ